MSGPFASELERLAVRTELSGHSGCRLFVWQDLSSRALFVRKISKSIAYNQRLKKQCFKQSRFVCPGLYTPTVLRQGYDEQGLFWFDMPYIKGKSFADWMKDMQAQDVVDYAKLLFSSISYKECRTLQAPSSIFQAKVENLATALLPSNTTPAVASAITKLRTWDFSSVPPTPCAGDLTLENILVEEKSGKLFLIDFLDSFFDSWMFDIAKILQDVDCGWTWRHAPSDTNRNLRCALAKNAIVQALGELPGGTANIVHVYHILILNLLRIYPYVAEDDQSTRAFLNNALSNVLHTTNNWEKIL